MKPVPYLILFLLTLPLLADEPRTVRLTLSPETTFLTEPQLPDGRIDYIAALNKKLSAQTTPENNLLVGIHTLIFGEKDEAILREPKTQEDMERQEADRRYREQFWQMLGADAPSLDSLVAITPVGFAPFLSTKDYEKALLEFYTREELAPMIETQRERDMNRQKSRLDGGTITQEEYEAEIKKIETEIQDWYYRDIVQDQWWASLRRPWSAEDYPYLAHWITATDVWTPKLIDISRQYTGYYYPHISNSALVFEASLSYVQSLRQTARFFQMRGNLEFAQGRFDQAMECAFSPIRMGRTIRMGTSWIVEDLVGIAMTGMGNYQLTTYLAELSKEKDATWILQKKKEYDAIEVEFGPLPWLPVWGLHERVGMLSFIQAIAVEPKVAHEFLKTCFDQEDIDKYEKLFNSGIEYDWDKIMRQVNLFYDDMEEMLLIQNRQRRLRAAARLEQRIAEYGKRCIDSDATPERKATDFLLGNFAPATEALMIALTRIEWDSRVTSVTFALAAYRADNEGESPDTLEQLVPHYLDKIPDSPFTDQPLRYLKRENDVLIANDETYQLDGSEEDVEKLIADAKPGVRVFPTARSYVLVVSKK